MAGHSKWANIKHRKGRQDAKRGKIFSRLIRELTVASKLGGPIAEDNPRLRTALDKALGANMPKDTIERAIKRGSGDVEGASLEEVTFEGYGPGGVAIMVESMTDNNNRTVAEVRHAFSKAGGNLSTDGSVAYLFINRGLIQVSSNFNLDLVMDVSIEAGAEDVEENLDGSLTIFTKPEDLNIVQETLMKKEITILQSEITLVPETSVSSDIDHSLKVYRLLETLEDLEDTQNVYSNAHFPDSMLELLDKS